MIIIRNAQEWAIALLDFYKEDESKWTTEYPARDAFGKPCSADSSKACRWCLVGAAWKLGLSWRTSCDLLTYFDGHIGNWQDKHGFAATMNKLREIARV